MKKTSLMRRYTHLIACIILPSLMQLPPAAYAQSSSQLEGSQPHSLRALALCPELAKFAEAIALARDIGHSKQQTIRIIHRAITPKDYEVIFSQQMVDFVYNTPELTPYEHSKHAEAACFEGFGYQHTDGQLEEVNSSSPQLQIPNTQESITQEEVENAPPL